MTNFTGFIGFRIRVSKKGYYHKVRNQNCHLSVESIELFKIDHKYSISGVNIPVEATIINIENRYQND